MNNNNVIFEESDGTHEYPKSTIYSATNSAVASRSSSQTNIHVLSSTESYNEGDTEAYKRRSVLLSPRLSSAFLVETLQVGINPLRCHLSI